MDYLLCGNLPYPAWKKHISVQNLSNRRIRRYLVCRLKRPEARDFSHVRFTNVLKTMPDKLAEAKDRLETLTNQLESAKIEVTKPFQQEEELAEKLKRLAELNALLNMDEKGTDALILEDDEQPAIVNSDMAVTPITSVKTKPMLKKKVVGLCL